MITKENYLDWFLLYVDNELDNDQKKLVDQFVATHPEIEEEFLALQETVLPVENFDQNWDNLLKIGNTDNANWEEKMLLHLDNELAKNEQIDLQNHLKNNASDKKNWEALQQTVLPLETISYPNKSELLRKEKGRIIPIWIKVASIAAALLLVCFSIFQWTKTEIPSEIVLNSNPKKTILNQTKTNPVASDSDKLTPKLNQVQKSTEQILASNKPEKKSSIEPKKSISAKKQSIGDPQDQISDDDHWKKSEQFVLAKVDIAPTTKNDIPNVIASTQKIELINLQEKNNVTTTKSSKRMIFAADFNSDDDVYVANTSISTKKILKFFKGKKEEDKKATQTNHL
ncbi:anti-sigma factor [Rhizosphaericola mali]|uniref:Uncharacterized protein n=1 Tax=Rhizosphaericola mali TaxID=2545455 RepID=A0A5P2G8F2_9BACT|nr:hypothetical protein [Rhizosphaericola mali]QES90192.1 hypothetical protein E0W69_016555 [Rhizosphaericola mali]